MSLLKQLFLAICLFLVVAFSGSFVSSVENSREQLRGQLRSHAQDAATALGLSLTPHVDDPAMVQLMVSSIFDSGYFASIRVIDIKSGKPLVERVQAHAERTVPGWFERLVDLQPQGGDALIMRGWEQAARVEVVSHPQFALARLWDSALGSLYWLLACGAASLLLGGWLLRRQLRPLDQMVRQAHAISRREFLSLPRLPRTPELRRVVQAMNQMVEKLRTLFAEEAARSDKLRAQAYQDSLTGLPNRRLFDARLNEQLGAGEHEHAGQLLLLRLNDLNGLNQRLGGQRTDELIQAVARLLVDSCGQQGRTDWLLARSRGGEFAVLAPGCSREQAERLAEELCEGLENLARTGASDLTPVAYLGISAFAEGDSPADLMARADQALAQAESQPAQPWASQDGTALAALNDSQDWHDWIDQALTERRLLLYFQPVVDCLDTQRVLHHKVLARLLDPQTFKTREVLRLERHPEHFNNLHGCLLGNRLLLNAKVYNSPHHAYGTQRLTCYDLESRGTLWGATLSAQVSAFAPLPGGQWIALALVDGQVEVRDLASGECRWRYRTADAIPLCLAVSDKLLAIGFSHGGVSLLQVAADGQLIGPPGANPRQ